MNIVKIFLCFASQVDKHSVLFAFWLFTVHRVACPIRLSVSVGRLVFNFEETYGEGKVLDYS